jgi:TonB family protein
LSTCRTILLLCALSAWGQEYKITPTEAARLEKVLETNPEDVAARERLLTYFAGRSDDASRLSRFHLLLWLIDNHPESPLFSKESAVLKPADFRPPYEADLRVIAASWQREAAAHPEDVRILGNAVRELYQVNYPLMAECLKQLRKIDSTNPRWVVLLASLYGSAVTSADLRKTAFADLEACKDLPVIGMAGQGFYALGKKSNASQLTQLGEALLKRAQALDPLNPRWAPSAEKPGLLTERDMWPYGNVPQIRVPESAVHLAGESEATRLVHKVPPDCTPGPNVVCPQKATTQKLAVRIGKDGHVKYVHAMSGDLSTIPSAMDAAWDWVFKPAVIDGEVVEIVTDVEVAYPAPKALSAPPKESNFVPPVAISRVEAEYTPEAHNAKLTGSVIVSLIVDEQGQPKDIKVVRGLGSGLDQKAMEAVAKWRFRPGTKDGKPIAVPAKVEVQFKTQ